MLVKTQKVGKMTYDPRYNLASPWDVPEKVKYREDTIIDPYRKFFEESIPEHMQYWTLGGAHYDEKKGASLQGEFGQLMKVRLLQNAGQFHSVDRNQQMIDRNRETYPDANWYCGEFQDVMSQAVHDKWFNPAVIHFDAVQCIETVICDVKRLFSLIDEAVPHGMLFVVNMILKNPHALSRESDGDEFMAALLAEYSCPVHWRAMRQYYKYGGAGGKSRSVMGTCTWIKEPHVEMIYNGHNIILET